MSKRKSREPQVVCAGSNSVTDEAKVVFHHTDTGFFPWLLASGRIKTCGDGWLWATTRPEGDPTANCVRDPLSILSFKSTALVRLVLPADQFMPWRVAIRTHPRQFTADEIRGYVRENTHPHPQTTWYLRKTYLPLEWVIRAEWKTRRDQETAWRPMQLKAEIHPGDPMLRAVMLEDTAWISYRRVENEGYGWQHYPTSRSRSEWESMKLPAELQSEIAGLERKYAEMQRLTEYFSRQWDDINQGRWEDEEDWDEDQQEDEREKFITQHVDWEMDALEEKADSDKGDLKNAEEEKDHDKL
jgi:hypothetical protein